MGKCQYVDDTHSYLDGYWCSHLDQHVEWTDARNFCASETGSDRCPFLNGTPILTEKIGRQISDAFHSCTCAAKENMSRMSQQIASIASQTSMESISELCTALRDMRISVPHATGIFQGHLNLKSEEEVASSVESSVSSDMYSLRDMDAYPPSLSGETSVSSQDFEQVINAIQSYGSQAVEVMRLFHAGLSGGERQFEEPVRHLATICADALNAQIQNLCADAKSAAQDFESGVAQAEAAAKRENRVLSFANVDWVFGDY